MHKLLVSHHALYKKHRVNEFHHEKVVEYNSYTVDLF